MDGLIPAHILAARNGLSGFTSEYVKLGRKFGKGVLKWEVEGKLLGMDFIKTYNIYAQNSQLKREKRKHYTKNINKFYC